MVMRRLVVSVVLVSLIAVCSASLIGCKASASATGGSKGEGPSVEVGVKMDKGVASKGK